MNQHTRFNLPICLVVEEDAFFHSDEIIRRYIPEITGQKTIVVSEDFLIGIYKEKITDISRDFGNAEIVAMKSASFDEPMGDPMELEIHGYSLTLRIADADRIEVTPLSEKTASVAYKKKTKTHHPGLGEGGIFHAKGDGDPLPANEQLTFALVGNQNCGKTTLFNRLTGSNQHVGNFPGVTVDRKDGPIKGYSNTLVTDLPGIYSMSPYSSEEIVSRNFVLDNKPSSWILRELCGTLLQSSCPF